MNNTPLMPEDWSYHDFATVGSGYRYVVHSKSGALALQWMFDWTEAPPLQKAYREHCNSHRIMLRPKIGEPYEPMPEEITNLQQAVDYLHVLLRMM